MKAWLVATVLGATLFLSKFFGREMVLVVLMGQEISTLCSELDKLKSIMF